MNKQDKKVKKVLKTKSSKSTRFLTPLTITTAAFFTLALVMCLVLVFTNVSEVSREAERTEIIQSQTFHDGIKIGGVDVSGMTYSEALNALKSVEDNIASEIHFTLKYDGGDFELDRNNLNVLFNTEEILSDAMGIGRNGGYLSIKNDIQKFSEGVDYNIEYTLDATPLFTALDPIIEEIDVAPVNAKAVVDESVHVGYSSVVRGFPFKVVSEVDGVMVDKDALYQTLTERAQNRDFGEVEIPIVPVYASVTSQNIRDNLVLRAWYSTSYANGNSSNRVYNIQRASNNINGTVVEPGDEFSCNTVIGPRYLSNGWKLAPAVISGGAATEDQAGGGVCQVSTTLYNAVVKSDLQIVSRRPHSKQSTYVDGGLDATINTGTIDFIWKNNTNYPVYVFSWLDKSAQEVYCAIFAEKFPSDFDRIEFISVFDHDIEPTDTEYSVTSKLTDGQWMLRNKAITGHVYKTYAQYYKDGKLVNTKPVSTSTYKMHPKRYYVAADFNGVFDPSKEVVESSSGKWVLKRKGGATTTEEPDDPNVDTDQTVDQPDQTNQDQTDQVDQIDQTLPDDQQP